MKRPCIGIISRHRSASRMLDHLLWPTATRHLRPEEAARHAAGCDALLVDVALVTGEHPEIEQMMCQQPVVALFAPALAASGRPWVFPWEGRIENMPLRQAAATSMETVFVQLRDDDAPRPHAPDTSTQPSTTSSTLEQQPSSIMTTESTLRPRGS